MSKPVRPRRPLIEAIEPRLLFSATADIAVFDDASHYVDSLAHAANNLDLTQVYPDLIAQSHAVTVDANKSTNQIADQIDTHETLVALETSQDNQVHSLVFVDTHVANYQTLVQDILNNNKDVEIIYLDANQDGIAQITQSLSLFSNVTSIHLISHSVAGELQLGSSVLTENNIAQFKNELTGWQKNLTNDADILIYGCDLAANDAGVHLMQQLNEFTGADIAASTNKTGNATQADWVLEKHIGNIDTTSLMSAQQNVTWKGVLADVTYINTGSGGSNYVLVPGDFAGQSFQYTSTITVDRFSVEINKTAGAAAQNLILEIRDGYNGNLVGSATVSSNTLSNGLQWVNFNFAEASLTAYQVYWVRLSTTGTDHLVAATYHNTDVYSTGTFFNNSGGAPWDLSFAVTNAATNAAPSVAITPTTYSATEQVALNLHGTGISVADADGDNLTVTIAATSNNSQVTANAGTTGVGITSGNGTNNLVISGTIAQLNNFFNGNNGATLTYRIAANTPPASSTLTISASDGFLSSNDTAIINITAVNDAPVNTVPGTQNINEDTALVFSTTNGNKISIADVDAFNNPVRTSISVNNGVLTLAGTTGLTFTTGNGTNNSTMVFSGTITDINAALATLTYQPNTNFNGADTFTIITNDLGNTGTGGALSDTDSFTINIAAVNDAPVVAHAIPNQNAPKNVAFNFAFAANTFSDVDGNSLTYAVQLNGGGALPSWLSFNAATRTFSGTPSNSDVGTLNIDVTANDGNGGTVTNTFAIITSANLDTNYIDTGENNYELTVSNTQQVGQSFSYNSGNGTYLANEVSLFIAAYGGMPQTVTVELLDAWNGNVLGSDNVASADLAQTNKEWYSFDFSNVTLTDGVTYYIKVSSTGSDNAIKLGHWTDVIGGNVLINGVDDVSKDLVFKLGYENGSNIAPAVAHPITDKALSSEETLNFTVPANTFSDADPLDTLTYRAHLVGRSDLSWITFDTATRQFGGTPHFSQIGTWNVEVVATDNHGASTSEFFDIVVSNANTVPTPIPDQVVTEGTPYNFQFAAFNNANGHALTYTATQVNGDPLPAWLQFDSTTRTFYGMADDGDVNVKNIKVTASDPFGGSISDTFILTVNNLQEPPFIANPIATQNAIGYVPFNFSFGANVAADPDIGDTLTYSVQLAGGAALPSWLSYDSATRTFSGTPTNANIGTISIDVIATDTANNSVTDTFNLIISAGNTPPVNTVPGLQYTNEDTPLIFSSINANQIQIADADAGSSNVRVTLAVGNGGLSLANTTGLTFNSGDGTDDANMIFTGTIADINNALGTLTYRSAANYFGADTFTITTNDLGNTGAGGPHSDTDSVSIFILSVNDAPTVANPISNQNATEDAAFNFQFASNTFNDVDVGDSLSYTAQLNGGGALPSWLNFDAATRTFSGTPANADVGTISIDVIANDGHGGTTTDTFNISVAPVNDAPINSVPGAQVILEDTALVFSATNGNQIQINDVDVASGNLEITLSATNGTLTLASTTGLSFTTGNGTANSTLVFTGTLTDINTALATLTFDPSSNYNGAALVSITTNDLGNTGSGGALTDTDIINITITADNDAPTIANVIPNQNANEDSAFNFQFSANTFIDVDAGDILTYSAQLNGGSSLPSWLSFNSATRTFSGTPTNNDVGTISIDVIANDGNGGTVTDTFNIVIANTNDAPIVANVIPNQNAIEDSAFNFQFAANTFADPDVGDTLTYSAQLAGVGALPTWLSFDSITRTFSGTPVNANVGTVSIDVIASDGNGGTVASTFDIVIANTNDAPTIANPIPNQSAIEDSAFNFQFASNTFNDIDVGDNLTYTSQLNGGGALPSWLSFNAATRTFSGTPTNADVGTLHIEVIANDANGGIVTNTFDLIIANTNDAPTIANPIPNQNAIEDSAFNFQFASNTFNDIDVGDNLTYTSQLNGGGALPSWLSFNAATRTFSGTPTNADVGTLHIEVIANDANGGIVTNTFDLIIANTNDAPTIANPIPNQNAIEDSAFNFQFSSNTFNDIDVGDNLTYTSQLNGGGALPSWLSFNAATRTFSGTPTHGDDGIITLDVIATDIQGKSITTQFAINILHTNQAPTTTGIATINTLENSAGDSVDLFAAFADREDTDAQLTFSIVSNTKNTLVNQTIIDSQTGKLQLHYGENQFGSAQLIVRATDSQGASIDTSFIVNVAFVNHTPVSSGIKNIEVIQGSAPTRLNLADVFTDFENGVNLQYSLISNSNPALLQSVQFNQQTHISTINYNSLAIGEGTIVLRATDSHGGFVDTEFKITILQKPALPPNPTLPLPTDNNPAPGNPGNNHTGGSEQNNTAPADNKEFIPPVGGGKNSADVIPNSDSPLINNLIGHSDGDIQSAIIATQVNATAEEFDHNRYDRIVEQQETLAKKGIDLFNTRPLISSLIIPGEGFSDSDAEEFSAQLRKIRQEMDNTIEEEQQQKALVTGLTLSVTTGILIWSLRASSLLLTLMSMLPLWRGIDPLPILEEVNKRKKDIEKQRSDRKAEDQNAKEVGYLFDNTDNYIKKTKDKG